MAQNSFGKVYDPRCVGNYLRRELGKRNLTQAKFAEMIGADERTVRRWFKSGVDSLTTVFVIANCLGVNAQDVIFSEDDVPFSGNPAIPCGNAA